jgi:nucleoside-diphosphate-sugar epimerase
MGSFCDTASFSRKTLGTARKVQPRAGARRQEIPIIGLGEGVWSFVQIEDAALATVAALTAPPGLYNVVDDDPSPVSRRLPAFSRWVGAPPPLQVTEHRGGNEAARTPCTMV